MFYNKCAHNALRIRIKAPSNHLLVSQIKVKLRCGEGKR